MPRTANTNILLNMDVLLKSSKCSGVVENTDDSAFFARDYISSKRGQEQPKGQGF